MEIKINAYYLPVYQTKNRNGYITLLVPDSADRDKINNSAAAICGNPEVPAKTPLQYRGGDWLLSVKVPTTACFSMDQIGCRMNDLLGCAVTVRLKMRRYTLISKFEANLGEKIIGVTFAVINMAVV